MSAVETEPAPGAQWRALRRSRWAPPVALLLGLLAVLELAGALLPGPGGPRSSSYATAADGVAAYAALLGREGHAVTPLRRGLDAAPLDPGTTLVLLDPDVVVAPEARALKAFVAAGGRLVAGGRDPGRWLATLLDRPPKWSEEGLLAAGPVGGAGELNGVRRVRAAGEGAWKTPGSARAILGGPAGTLAVTRSIGRGRMVLLADPSPLQNRLLDQADNAALGEALAGGTGRPVLFAETVHGYGRGRGLGALPTRWKWALGGLVLAALLWLAAHVRRLGPAEEEGRSLPPPRRAYVDAMAALLARSGRLPEAGAPVAAAARDRLLRRAALPPDAEDEAVAKAAERLELGPEEARALAGPPRTEDEALAAGRALAGLNGTKA